MLKVLKRNFFNGPNRWSPASGLLLVVGNDNANDYDFNVWKPVDHELRAVIELIYEVFPVSRESRALSSIRLVQESPIPFMALLFAVAEIIMRDFSVRPRMGHLIENSRDEFCTFLPCNEEIIGFHAWMLSMELVNYIPSFSGQGRDQLAQHLKSRYQEVRMISRRYGLNQSTMALARAAFQRNIPVYRISSPGQFLQLGQGQYRKRVMETATDGTSSVGSMMSKDKYATILLLHSHGIPTPGTQIALSIQQAETIARQIGYPVVVKPRSSGKGKGVTVDIRTRDDLSSALQIASGFKSGIIVERYIKGEDHRLFVVDGRLIAAAKRIPAQVVGDGKQSIQRLIEDLNSDPRRGMAFERLLEEIVIDQEVIQKLAEAGMNLDSVPAAGQPVRLRGAANISLGGTSIDVTDSVHPDNRIMAERVARLVGLDVAGIDFLTPDISQSWKHISCGILEVNATPGFRPHLGANPGRDVAGPIIDHLFPHGANGRIPTVGITGSIGKTTTCRMTASIVSHDNKMVAISTTQGAWIGNDLVRLGDVAGGRMASNLLQDPSVEVGIFELSRGGLVKKGMGLDTIDVGVVLNVLDNHIGLNGIESREEIASVKQLVIENARKVAVLNADDPLCLGMRSLVQAPRLFLVSMVPDNPAVLLHQGMGGTVAYLDNLDSGPELHLYDGKNHVGNISSLNIPATWGGQFKPAITHALFSMTVAHGLGVGFSTIQTALEKFQSTFETNPGRMNFVSGLPYKLCVTGPDGAVAMRALAQFIGGLEVNGKKRLMFCAIGDRPDSFILDSAKAVSGCFTDYICCDWNDPRGRAEGEAARLLFAGLCQAGTSEEQISMISMHDEALEYAMASSEPEDLLVIVTFSEMNVVQKAMKQVRC